MKMIKWEYYRIFKERVQNFFIFRDMKFRLAFIIYCSAKILETIAFFLFAKNFKNSLYFNYIICAIIIFNYILDVRESKSRINTSLKTNGMKNFYLTNSKYTEKQFRNGLCIVEVLWNFSNASALNLPLLSLMISKYTDSLIAIIFLTFFCIFLMMVLQFFINYDIEKDIIEFNIFIKMLMASIFLYIGNCISDNVFKCPLTAKKDVVKLFKNWLLQFKNVKWFLPKECIIRYIICIILIVCWGKLLKNKKSYLICEKSGLNLRDIGYFPIIFANLLCGILMGRNYNGNYVYLFDILMITYSLAYFWDDIFYFHDELLFDSEGIKIYFWKNNMIKLLENKKKIFYDSYVKKIISLYCILYFVTIQNLENIVDISFNLLIAFIMCFIAFYEKNIAIIQSPIKISENYASMKYNKNRMLENEVINGKLITIAIILSIPAILLSCGEINKIVFRITEILEIFILIIYSSYIKYKLKKNLNNNMVTLLFDEDEN